MQVNFYFEDVTYSRQRTGRASRSTTTTEVARELENRYHILEHFLELHSADIEQLVADSVDSAMEVSQEHSWKGYLSNLLWDFIGKGPVDPFRRAEKEIAGLFRRFLIYKEMDKMGVPGVPTKRSLGSQWKYGVQTAARPSFIDTGLYAQSFRVEIR